MAERLVAQRQRRVEPAEPAQRRGDARAVFAQGGAAADGFPVGDGGGQELGPGLVALQGDQGAAAHGIAGHDLDERQVQVIADRVGLVALSQVLRALPELHQGDRAEGEGVDQGERMLEPARVGRALGHRLGSLIGEALDPELGGTAPFQHGRIGVVVHELDQMAVPLEAVIAADPLAPPGGFGEIADPEAVHAGGGVGDHLQILAAVITGRLVERCQPLERRGHLGPGGVVDPDAEERKRQRQLILQRLRQWHRGVERLADGIGGPALGRHLGRAQRHPQVELEPVARAARGHPGNLRKPLPKLADGFREGRCRHRLAARLQIERGGLFRHAGRGAVKRAFHDVVAGLRLEEADDLAVQLLLAEPQQAVIGRVAQQRVFELVAAGRGFAVVKDDLDLGELIQRAAQSLFGQARDGEEQVVGKLPPDAGPDLGDVLDRGLAVEPGHQRVVQRGRDREVHLVAQHLIAIRGFHDIFRVEHGAGELFDIERHPVRLVGDLRLDRRGQRLAAGELVDQPPAFAPPQPVERQVRQMREGLPGRDEIGPESQQQEDRLALRRGDEAADQVERGRVGPVQVFHHQQHRCGAGKGGDLFEQHQQGLFQLPLRAHVERRIARLDRQIEHGAQQRDGLGEGARGLAEDRLQLVELDVRAVAALEPGGAFHRTRHRVKGDVAEIMRTLVPQDRLRLGLERFVQLADHPAFADPRLAGQQDDLAFARDDVTPAVLHQLQIAQPAHHRGDPGCRIGGVEAAVGGDLVLDPPDLDRRVDALDLAAAQIDGLERGFQQGAGAVVDQQLPGFGQILQAAGAVRGIARDRSTLMRGLAREVADHHRARRHRRPGRKPRIGAEDGDLGDRLERGAPCPDRTFGLILGGDGPAEMGDDAVPGEIRDMPALRRDRFGHGVLIPELDLAQVFGVELRGKRGRSDHVAEQHRDLPPFDGLLARIRGRLCRRLGDGGAFLQQPPPVADKIDAQILEVFAGEIGEDGPVDIVGDEGLAVDAQAQFLQPEADILHMYSSPARNL